MIRTITAPRRIDNLNLYVRSAVDKAQLTPGLLHIEMAPGRGYRTVGNSIVRSTIELPEIRVRMNSQAPQARSMLEQLTQWHNDGTTVHVMFRGDCDLAILRGSVDLPIPSAAVLESLTP